VQDPFAQRYRKIVRPRACAMGGEAVAIVLSSTSQGLTTSGTATNASMKASNEFGPHLHQFLGSDGA
jgi:hypothetical protein